MVLVAFFQIHSLIGVGILVIMSVLWILSLILKDSSIVDIFWGLGFVIAVWAAFLLVSSSGARDWLIAALVSIWGIRLTIHVGARNIGKGEDFRYTKMREKRSGHWWWQSLFIVFIFQGILMWVIASPLTAIQLPSVDDSLGFLDYLGVIVWAIGFFFEAVGDYQLSRFKANPDNRGRLLKTGLWRFTRHPNYFGDAAQWWGFYLIALSAGAWWTVVSPLLMTYLLVRVSGVALLERSLKEGKEGYEAYADKTNAFLPWFPKNE